MWIVRLALRRPYTFVVAALVILIMGPLVILRTPTDIFPNINIPVISVLWNFAGLSAAEIANRIVVQHERILTTTVDNIEHIESQSLNGVGVEKIFFHEGADISTATAQVTSVSQTVLRLLPAGVQPPLIINYTASTVPILQLALSGQGLTEQQLSDLGTNFIRTQLITVQGAAVPYPYGGRQREIMVDLNTQALQAKGLSPVDVVNAISAQNLILPSGTSKIGTFEYDVAMNGSPQTVAALNDLPIETVGGTTTYIHDVAQVRDGSPPQTNLVRVNGQRSVLLTILKNGAASTLTIIEQVKAILPTILAGLPPALRVKPLVDQSIFVRAAITGVVREATIAACLTGLMILVFLGSWRSTVIVAVSIPLSILISIICMSALGETINIMTLGGLALAVGILVDDATVEIENINRQFAMGKEIEHAILDGAQQIAVPAFVATLSICIVFVPMFFLSGVARFLFVPLAEAVVFAMLASYLLSRTLVPTMAKYLLRGHAHVEGAPPPPSAGMFGRFQYGFEKRFERFRDWYHSWLEAAIESKLVFGACFLGFCLLSFALVPFLGQDFFPAVDGGQFKLHMRARTGTRIEETARICDQVEDSIRQAIPPAEVDNIIDNIGLPYSSINLSYSNSAPVGSGDADIQVVLAEHHRPTAGYVHDLRLRLAQQFPGVTFYFLPADMVSQILNFGLPAPIDIQVIGGNLDGNRIFANRLLNQARQVPGTVDMRIQQTFDQPRLNVFVNRTMTNEEGFTQRDVSTNALVSLSGSFQTTPSYWLDPNSGVSYQIAVQTPQYRNDSLQDLENIPVSGPSGRTPQILSNVSTISLAEEQGTVSHYNAQPVIDIYGNVQGRDLGGVAGELMNLVDKAKKDLPRGSQIIVRGQIQTMRDSYIGLLGGLVFSILLVYLLIVVNFQSWMDPLIIISALPAALAGIVWMLFATGTTLSVPALTGAIMCMGVATANSILVVSFAKEQLRDGLTPREAASQAGFTRFRPVLMTALAMIIGMSPMALGLGEGGEQNAPLGRAVIGGLLFATISTLLFVPIVFCSVHEWLEARRADA